MKLTQIRNSGSIKPNKRKCTKNNN